MSLIFNPTSGVAYLETEEAVPWASLGCRPYTHFVLLETTESKAHSQYVWSTGTFQAPNSLNMYYAPDGTLYGVGGPGTTEKNASATSPAFGDGLLRLAVIRGLGVQNSNANFDYQAINLGTQLGSSSVQISSSGIQKYTTGGANALAATKLTLGDRQTTPEDRKFFGTMHFAGSVNRALADNELIAILKGDIQVLDYFKHDLVELWDFQRSDASALTGLISGTTLKMFGGSNLTWDQSAPLPVSKTRGHTILGATNRSILTPVWTFGESSDGSDIIKCSKSNLVISSNAAQIIWSETVNCTTSELFLSSKDCAIVLNDPPLIFDTDDYPDRYVFDVYQTPPDVDVIACTSADIAIQTNSCVIVDAENIHCSQHPLTLNAYSCNIFETALDALNCLKAELNLQTNICAVLQSEIINCVSHNLDLSSNAVEIAEKLIIESAVSNISLIAYDCDIQAFQPINCNQDSFLLQAQSFELLEKEFIFCSAASLSLQNTICNIVEQGLDIVYSYRADINIKSNNSVILYDELIDCSSASIALSAEVSEIYETEILSSDTQVLQLISNNCQLIEQGLDVIGCSKNVTLLIANKCNIVQEGLDVIYCNESTLQISGNKFSTAEIDIISCQVANLSLLANKSFVADTQSILCQEYSVSLVSNICNIVEAGLDVIHAKRADLRLDPINCEIIEFGFDNILCNVGSVQLAAQNCDVYDIEVISCVSATLDVQSSSCDIIEEGLNVVHCKTADIELISNKFSIAENEIVNCEQGLVTAQTKKCQIIEFIDFRATKLDLISNSSSVLSNEAINCNAAIININSKRALIVDSNVPPILWSGKIVVNGYVEPIRGIA